MPLYGSIAQVKKMLRPSEASTFGTDVDDRLTALQAAVSATLEEELGRSFGVPASTTTDIVWAGDDPVLVLPRPYRSITEVRENCVVSGVTATGGTVISAADYVYDPYDRERGWIYGLRLLLSGRWGRRDEYGNPAVPVVVTGYLAAGDDDTAVPDEITYVANYLMLELFKRENASPAGVIGPDGIAAPLRNPYTEPHVVAVLDKHRTRRRHLVV